ncbi:MAG: Smr/MutS family protein [Flavobacteriales bacterium]|nr:Smr/MutS family protein [Flavobacteriales bacterium]
MDFKRGDRVRFLNDPGEGTIIAFPSKGVALVEDDSGFAYEHPLSELVPTSDWWVEETAYNEVLPDIQDMLDRNIDKELTRKADKEFRQKYKGKEGTMNHRSDVMEVDLHIHELVEDHGKMENGEIVDIQLRHFERMLRMAEERKIPRVVFIHGVGQGVLRAEIRKLLREYYPHATFMDAPYSTYGYGATEVRLRS